MSTAECIETISQVWWLSTELTGESETSPNDWKRVSKRKGSDGNSFVRIFEYRPNGQQMVFITNADDDAEDEYEIVHAGDWLYAYNEYEQGGERIHSFSFTPEAYWQREKAIFDQHVSGILRSLYGIDVEDFEGGEDMENIIEIPEENVEEAKKVFDAAGLKYSKEMSNFLVSFA